MSPERFVQGAVLSYRALFSWLNPVGYLSSRVIRPIGLAITFGALGAHYGVRLGWVVIGAGMLAGAHAVVFGAALSVGNERVYGTLDIWLASPQNKLGALCQRGLPHLVDGVLGGTITYLVCALLFRTLPLPVPLFVAVLLLGLLALSGFGVLIGGAAMVVTDIFVIPNLAYLAIMLLSGTLVPTATLPGLVRPLAQVCPTYHVMRYAVGAHHGGAGLLTAGAWELGTGLVWFLLGSVAVRTAVSRARR
jgi:ABC-type multidrug transport system permease subunit